MLGLIGGALMATYGLGEAIYAIRSGMPRWMVAQGTFFIELGLSFVFMEALPEGTVRTALVSAFGVSALISVAIQHKLMRAERAALRR